MEAAGDAVFRRRNHPRLLGSIRALGRLAFLLGWTFVAMPIQAGCLASPGRAKIAFARFYWATFCRLFGIRVRVIGQHAKGRRVVFVSITPPGWTFRYWAASWRPASCPKAKSAPGR